MTNHIDQKVFDVLVSRKKRSISSISLSQKEVEFILAAYKANFPVLATLEEAVEERYSGKDPI